MDANREVSILIEHLPYKDGKYFSLDDKTYRKIDVIEEVSSCLKNKEMSEDLINLIELKTALYMSGKPKNEYVALATCCIKNGVYFGGAENIETQNTSLFGGNLLQRVINGDKAFISSIESTRQLPSQSQDKKPLLILLCGQAHLFGVKHALQKQGLNVYSWAIQSKLENGNISKQSSVTSDEIIDHFKLKQYFSIEYPDVTVDLQSIIDLEIESKYSAETLQSRKNTSGSSMTADFKERVNQLKSDDEPSGEKIIEP